MPEKANPICKLCTHLDKHDLCSKPRCTPQTGYPQIDHYSSLPSPSILFAIEEIRRLEREIINLKMQFNTRAELDSSDEDR